jgi:hypothetical protein
VVNSDGDIYDAGDLVFTQLGGMARGEFKDQTTRVGLCGPLPTRRSLNYIVCANLFSQCFCKRLKHLLNIFYCRVVWKANPKLQYIWLNSVVCKE